MNPERSRKTFKIIFQRLSKHGQVHVADKLHTSESTMSRMANNLQLFANMLTVLGLKVVPVEHQCRPPEYIESIENLARLYINSGQRPPEVDEDMEIPEQQTKLTFEDED